MLENKHLPAEDKMGKADGKVIADSCHIILYFDQKASFGDTLAAMKMRLTELEKPIEDGVYYSNFDPVKRGYIRQNGIRQYQTFSLRSQTADSISRIYPNIRIKLDQPYTDREGASYSNYSLKCGSSTDVENVNAEQASSKKILIDGQLFIMHNGAIYNVQGTRVK
jgi:hemin uptake protein HemP